MKGKREKRTDRLITAALILILLTGLSLLLYPTVSDRMNRKRSFRTIETYSATVEDMSEEKQAQLLAEAREYNGQLKPTIRPALPDEEGRKRYDSLLDIDGSGIMAYVEIPALGAEIPVYHGTEEKVLQRAVGHLEWTSLPVGGESTHSVLFGHRGLPSARLFTDLDILETGDVFRIKVLGETLSYEVDQILTVLPEETEPLNIVPGMDYCTLVTCTPYGVNSHRLMVRGHRITETEQTEAAIVTPEAAEVEPMMVALIVTIALTVLIGLGIGAAEKGILHFSGKKRTVSGMNENEDKQGSGGKTDEETE